MSLPVFPNFTKHPKLWFDDGNIVIAAQDTGFRLHKGVLAAKSSVMKTLFSLSQPTDAEKYEDLDVVRFEDDAAELEQFFNFLYNFSNHLLDRRIPEWKEVKALLGLGSKYEANDARREAIRLIRSVVPHSAEEWYNAFPGQKGLMRSNHAKDYIDMANTTYKHGLYRTHLGCLYRCCQLPTKDLLYGTPGGDGSLTCLPSEHLISCLEARPKLVRAHCNILEDVWNILPSEYCTTPSHCDPAIRNLCSPRFQDVYLMTDPIMLLWPGKLRVDKGDLLPGLCEYCREDAAEVLQAGRQEIFENIHRYFGKTKAQVDME